VAVYKQPKSKYWWYKFTWNGELIRESTKQTNKRVAEQMEAAHRTALAKGEVGIRERKPVPTLKQFAEDDFLPYVRSTFAAKPKTGAYYGYGVKSLLADEKLAGERLDAITSDKVAGYVAKRQEAGLQVASINRELQVLRRMFHLAQEWGKVEKVLPRVRMLSGERHRERVLSSAEEKRYLDQSAPLLRDVATIFLDCGLRPEECFRLKWENIRDGSIEIQYGKTDNARRRIPISQRVAAVLEMRHTADATSEWVFPAGTRSGHIEPASLKRQHLRACEGKANVMENRKRKPGEPKKWNVEPFPLYTLRHTCLTRWAPHMDPWALAYLAGHRDMSITKRYIHPQQSTLKEAIEKAQAAQGGHTFGHTAERPAGGETAGGTVTNYVYGG
jgi:integrase